MPDVDRYREDSQSLLACGMKKKQIMVGILKKGILKGLYCRSQFSVCLERLISIETQISSQCTLYGDRSRF